MKLTDICPHLQLEPDHWWWEVLRLDELGLPASWNFPVPDKAMHFWSVFLPACILGKWLKPWAAVLIPWLLMMVPWEILWDGCWRYGVSLPDMVADTLGGIVALWMLSRRDRMGQTDDLQK